MIYGHSGYLRRIFTPSELSKVVDQLHSKIEELKSAGLVFDSIAFTGNSGAGVAYPLSAKYGYNLVCIRKDHVHSHGRKVESSLDVVKNYIIVDDQIDSGSTVARIILTLDIATCKAIILYAIPFSRKYVSPFGEIPVYFKVRED